MISSTAWVRQHHTFARVLIQNASWSGKTTLSAVLAEVRGVECLELDGLYHQPDWTPLEVEEFREQVAAFAAQPVWVVDGNYSQVRDTLWPRATMIALIDLARRGGAPGSVSIAALHVELQGHG